MNVQRLCREAGCASVHVVLIPEDAPPSWNDLADEIPDGWDLNEIIGNAIPYETDAYVPLDGEETETVFDDGNFLEQEVNVITLLADAVIVSKAQAVNLSGFKRTEDGIALAFAHLYGDDLRYCKHTGKWFRWTGTRWEMEQTDLVFDMCRDLCRDMNKEEDPKLTRARTFSEVERCCKAARTFAVTIDIWDTDPWLLGTPGGVVDLRTGTLRPSARQDFITKQTAVTPNFEAEHPRWTKFLNEATKGDKNFEKFLQQFFGYSLTGDTREDALIFVYGDGGNGKTVLVNVISKIFGKYAVKAAIQTFTASQTDRHQTEIASMQGARLVYASETEDGRSWAEARIKEMTGGERRMRARFMRQDEFEFEPQFKLLFFGNHKPRLRNVTAATKRRFNVAPFINKPQEPDPLLETALEAEQPAILAWMIRGCLDWQKEGLLRPQVVTDATNIYFSEQDIVRQWIDECCDLNVNNKDTRAALFSSWAAFADANCEQQTTATWFYEEMRKNGFEEFKTKAERGFKGISVKLKDTGNQWQNQQDR